MPSFHCSVKLSLSMRLEPPTCWGCTLKCSNPSFAAWFVFRRRNAGVGPPKSILSYSLDPHSHSSGAHLDGAITMHGDLPPRRKQFSSCDACRNSRVGCDAFRKRTKSGQTIETCSRCAYRNKTCSFQVSFTLSLIHGSRHDV